MGVDVSQWQARVDWGLLFEKGVRFAIVKVSQGNYFIDPMRVKHVQGARDGGMVVGVYHWHDPLCSVESQVSQFERAIDGLEFDFSALDVEQQWASWEEWSKHAITKKISGKVISQTSEQFGKRMRSMTGKPVLIYTRTSFVDEHAPEMKAWLPGWDTWLAYYPYRPGRVSLGWEVLKRDLLPTIQHPSIPAGCGSWRLWQWSGDKFVLPGVSTAVDLNYFNGTEAELRRWVGSSSDGDPRSGTDVPEIEIKEKVRILWDNHQELHQKVMSI